MQVGLIGPGFAFAYQVGRSMAGFVRSGTVLEKTVRYTLWAEVQGET